MNELLVSRWYIDSDVLREATKGINMYERKRQKIATASVFMRRMIVHVLMAGLLSAVVLFMGIAGYHWIAGLSWVDSLLEASMILGGMGPVSPIATTGA